MYDWEQLFGSVYCFGVISNDDYQICSILLVLPRRLCFTWCLSVSPLATSHNNC